ncbi:MAG: HDOD domain-containing protein [Desulfovibrionaceae bacterium]
MHPTAGEFPYSPVPTPKSMPEPIPSGPCAGPALQPLDEILDGLDVCLRAPEADREHAATAAAALLADPGLVGRSMRCAARVLSANDLSRDTGRELLRVAFLAAARRLAAGGEAPAAACEPLEALRRRAEAEPRPGPGAVLQAGLPLLEDDGVPRRVLEALAHRYSNASRTAAAVARDAVLSGLVLRLVNSPFYGIGRRIDALERAVAFMGANELSALALAVGALRRFGDAGALAPGWRLRAVTTGVAAKLLARRTGASGEWFFAAGLLRDAAGLVLAGLAPARSALVWRLAVEQSRPLEAVRQEWFDFDPAEASGWLLEAWGLPTPLGDLVRHADVPEGAGDARGAAILHVAGVLAAVGAAGERRGPSAPRLDPEAWAGLGLPAGALGRVALEAADQAFAMRRVLEAA